jgi:hypothetical protein
MKKEVSKMGNKRKEKQNRFERLLLRSQFEKEMDKKMAEIWTLPWPRFI